MQKTPFVFVVIIGLFSFYSGSILVGKVYFAAAPYWRFGKEAVRRDHIRVISQTRQTITFSNEPSSPIQQRELWPLTLLDGPGWLIAVGSIFIITSRITVCILRRINPTFAQELSRATTPR